MAIIRLPQTGYATQTKKNQVTEAMQTWGEQAILFHAYNTTIDPEASRCPKCWDDVYTQSGEYQCTVCYGTTFDPPFKRISRVWAIFENSAKRETVSRRGEWVADSRTAYIEGWVTISPGDFLVRVKQWDVVHRPIELGNRYSVEDINESSLRTGANYAQQASDRLGQRVSVSMLHHDHPIYAMNISPSTPVNRYDGQWLGAEI